MIASRNRALDGAVAVAAAGLLACTFGAWTQSDTTSWNAWQGSAVWPAIVVLALAGAIGWMVTPRRGVRRAATGATVAAAAWALSYTAIRGDDVVFRWPGYLGIGLVIALGVLQAGDTVRRGTSRVQVVLGAGGGLLCALCALPWWFGLYTGGDAVSLWRASTVWTITVLVVILAVAVVLVRDSRSTRLLAALPAALAAGWALVFTLSLPAYWFPAPGHVQRTTVTIAKFTVGPRPFRRDHLVANGPFRMNGRVEYAVAGSIVMAALALVLLAAAVAAVRASSSPDR